MPENSEPLSVNVSSAALIQTNKALGISHCKPGECLDITRDLEVWTFVEHIQDFNSNQHDICLQTSELFVNIIPGFGVGKQSINGEISISQFAKKLIELNLSSYKYLKGSLNLEIIFPCGKKLAERTSNSAFGVIDGLALIGTQAEVQHSASPEQLRNTISQVKQRCSEKKFKGNLTFVIGENGLDLARKTGFNSEPIIKTGNWLGPLLVAAAKEGVNQLLIFGYHGKLIKLAGGIFHTHHHLADSRLEILIALAVREKVPLSFINNLDQASSIEEAFLILEKRDSSIAKKLWFRLAKEIEERSISYVKRYVSSPMKIGTVLFDRKRSVKWAGPLGIQKIRSLGLTIQDL